MVEKIKYKIIKEDDDFEIRKYPELILATVEKYSDNKAFGLLFNYISGENKAQEKISMAAPVISSKKIEMTSPVLSNDNFFAFVMPSKFSKDSIPVPLNSNVKIKFEPGKKLAVKKFSGYPSDKKIKKYKEKLYKELNKNDIKIKGEIILMRYNSPFSLPFLRRNEIGVEIEYD